MTEEELNKVTNMLDDAVLYPIFENTIFDAVVSAI